MSVKRRRLTSADAQHTSNLTAGALTQPATSEVNKQSHECETPPGAEPLEPSNLVSSGHAESASTPSNDPHTDIVTLPSIYSFSPVNVVKASDRLALSSELVDTGASPGSCSRTQENRAVSDVQTCSNAPVSDRVLEQLMEIFKERMIEYNPAISLLDLDNSSEILARHQNFAICVAYATAKAVPGGATIRARLLPTIVNLVQSFITEHLPEDSEQSLKILQGLLLLYAYTEIPTAAQGPKSGTEVKSELMFWSLKSLTESYAQRLRCHKSVEGVRAALKAGHADTAKLRVFKMYSCWIWLFIMAHYVSLVTATPPSIRADSSIFAGGIILRQSDPSIRVQSLAAELEICLVWEKLRTQGYDIGEWWCLPDDFTTRSPRHDSTAAEEACLHLEQCAERLRPITSNGFTGSRVAFHIRFAQFCIQSYNIRNLRLSEITPSQSENVHAVGKCLDAAISLLDWILAVDLSNRDSLRFASDSSWVMIGLCCRFALESLQSLHKLGQTLDDTKEILNKVKEVAEIMTSLSFGFSHGMSTYGEHIMSYANKVEAKFGNLRAANAIRTERSPASTPRTTNREVDRDLGINTLWFQDTEPDDLYLFPGLWDMSPWPGAFHLDDSQ
ncbi:hypothetical protein PV08_11436 [Exophiala spinifera]|uniref:Transcription factor domain-containing protein n=1 Tax=Exophiala spinifera TaxID=91928 RepID=A0A0D1ZBW2_9EURO|nr:uncharacterized protein PV08_11436 [Exophiala spinifera]KIW10472.1 hypothetical protein PV08_11436 [Exophiala spinifera]